MNVYLYSLFFAPGYGCVIVRDIYTISILLYILGVISYQLLKSISSIMFLPLLIALFGEYISCIYFKFAGLDCKQIKNIEINHESDTIQITERVNLVRYMYKLALLYFAVRYIKPDFNIMNIAVPTIGILTYFYMYPLDKSHLGKSLSINTMALNVFILINSICIYYIVSKLYNYIQLTHIVLLFLIYFILYFYY